MVSVSLAEPVPESKLNSIVSKGPNFITAKQQCFIPFKGNLLKANLLFMGLK